MTRFYRVFFYIYSMLLNQELKDKIEDALIHFEDAGYKFQITQDFFCNDNAFENFNKNVYDLLKKVRDNDVYEFGDRIFISLEKKHTLYWKEYQWYQSELRTAINRITDKFDNIEVRETQNTDITIKGKTWKFKNLKDLTEKTRYFNYNNTDFSNLVVYPEYHETEGIVVYAREILTEPNEKRFDVFNYLLSSDVNVSIERALGKDCVIKTYEEAEAEKENPYLSKSKLSNHIVAKLKCDFIKV